MKLTPWLAVIGLAGCTTTTTLSGVTPVPVEIVCDPLSPSPITLGSIVGVGKDAAGILYVDASNGIFVSDGTRLLRQHVTGTGQSGANEFIFTFEPSGSDAAAARELLVETTAGTTATRMALGPAGARNFLDQIDGGVTTLELVAPSALRGVPVVNTPNVISYIGDVADGAVIVATVPLNVDSTPQDGGVMDGGLSIFYGPPNAVAQRPVTAFQQTHSGNGALTFLVGQVPYVLTFGMVQGPDAGPLGTFALEGLTPRGSPTMAVTLRKSISTTTDPPGLTFDCLP